MYPKTFYIFNRGPVLKAKASHPNLWLYYQQGAFTLDSSGSNLPDYPSWKYYGENQPHQELLNYNLHLEAISSQKEVERGLSEKGWYVGHIYRHGIGSIEDPGPFRPPADDSLTTDKANQDFIELLGKLPRGKP
jgi:hypothetical protein